MQKSLLLGLGSLVLIAGGYLLYRDVPTLVQESESVNTASVINFEPREGEISITGVFDCTPKKDNKPILEGECVMGLKGDDGKFYSLDTSTMEDAKGENLVRVRAIGVFTPADSSNEEVGDYQYDGVLTVRTIESI